jgi:hypothetical protein
MNVIRHNNIATYCDVVGLLGALGKKNERSVDLILCQEPLSFVCAECDEIKRTCCEDSSQTWWSPSEITLHGKSYSSLDKTVAAVATALRAVSLNSSARWDRPQAGGYSSARNRQLQQFINRLCAVEIRDALP